MEKGLMLEQQAWWPAFLERRNQQSMRELAKEFDVPLSELVLALRRTQTPRTPVWSDEAAAEGDAPPAGEVTMGPPRTRPGSKDERIDQIRDQLGAISDREAAELAGVSQRTITSYRQRHSISAFTGRGAAKGSRRRSKLDPFVELVGRLPDREVAERAEVTLNAVRNYRHTRGIGAREELARAENTGGPTPRAASAGGIQYAWRVTFEGGKEGVVNAGSAGEAVERAERTGDRVIRLEMVGPLL